MLHKMKLNEKPFEDIKKGTKKIEFRLYDEKRRKLQLGDTIRFYKLSDETKTETLEVEIIGLLHYNSFIDLYRDVFLIGADESEILEEKINLMREIYSEEEERKHGVLGISIKLL